MKVHSMALAVLGSLALGALGAFMFVARLEGSPDLSAFIFLILVLAFDLFVLSRTVSLKWDVLTSSFGVAYLLAISGFITNTTDSTWNLLFAWFVLLAMNFHFVLKDMWQGIVVKYAYLSLIAYPFHLLLGPLTNILEIVKGFAGAGQLFTKLGSSRVKRGLQAGILFMIVGIPTILVVSGLLSSASTTFSDWMGGIFSFRFDGTIMFLRVLITPIIAWVLLAQCLFIFHISKNKEKLENQQLNLSDSTLESLGMALGLTLLVLNLFYVVFIVAQLRFDLGNLHQLIAERRLSSFSELAVARFWELIMVAMINMGIVFLGGKALRSVWRVTWLKMGAQLNVALLIINTLLLVVSAWQRLSLYVSGYGFSHKRFDAFAFLPVLIAIVLLVAGGFFYAKWQNAAHSGIVAITALFFGLILMLPSTFLINNLNHSLYQSGNISVFDPMYTIPVNGDDYLNLSSRNFFVNGYTNDVEDYDGLWVAAELVEGGESAPVSDAQREYLREELRTFMVKTNSRNWREFNLAEYLLKQRLKAYAPGTY